MGKKWELSGDKAVFFGELEAGCTDIIVYTLFINGAD